MKGWLTGVAFVFFNFRISNNKKKMLRAMSSTPLLTPIDVRVPPTMTQAIKPMLIFLIVALIIFWALSAWSYDNEKRQRAVQFWTGGLGVLGVIAVGCAVILLIYGARVVEDGIRTLQLQVTAISASVEKTSDTVNGGVQNLNLF